MCGRIIIKKSIQIIEEELHLEPNPSLHDFRGYNIGPGQYAPVLKPNGQFELLRFGLTPSWAKKSMLLFNARSEGDSNPNNEMHYSGAKGIIQKPAFRGPIRNKRGLVFVNGFLEGPEKEKLSKPYYVFDPDKDFFALAAIYDHWVDRESGEEVQGFAIITTASNKVTHAIGHHRSPVVIPPSNYKRWLNSEHLADVTPMLEPYGGPLNAYPISAQIKSPRENSLELLQPVGPAIIKGLRIQFDTEFDTLGFGRKKKL